MVRLWIHMAARVMHTATDDTARPFATGAGHDCFLG